MDNFNVPKKVNRHVLKALNLLSCNSENADGVTTARILHQVKYQMRNLVPVPNIERAVQKSLKNLSEVGLIQRHGSHRYALGQCFTPPPTAPPPRPNNQTGPDHRMFRGSERKRSRSDLDPNLKRNRHSDDSLSGDDFDRTRKRLRTNNKPLRHAGRSTFLPRARQHIQHSQRRPSRSQNSSRSHSRMHQHQRASLDMPLFTNVTSNMNYKHSHEQAVHNPSQLEVTPTAGNSNIEFLLATVTPAPSLEIKEITEEIKKIIEVRDIVETPPLTEGAKSSEDKAKDQEGTNAQEKETESQQNSNANANESKQGETSSGAQTKAPDMEVTTIEIMEESNDAVLNNGDKVESRQLNSRTSASNLSGQCVDSTNTPSVSVKAKTSSEAHKPPQTLTKIPNRITPPFYIN